LTNVDKERLVRIHDVKKLKERLLSEWRLLDYTIIAAAIAQCCSRLNACVRVNGGQSIKHKAFEVRQEHRSTQLARLLQGKALDVHQRLADDEVDDYDVLKAQLLKRFRLTGSNASTNC